MAKKAARKVTESRRLIHRPRSRASNPKKRPESAEHERTERALVAAIAEHRGQNLTRTQGRDLAWWRKQQAEKIADATLRAVSKGVFCDMAGRQQKVIDEAAERYDLPIDGPAIDLYQAIRCYHDLIAANARYIRPADDAEAAESGELDVDAMSFPELQAWKLREEIRKLQRGNERLAIAVTRDRGDSIDRRELREMLTWMSTRLEGLGQQLRHSSGGEEAQKCLNECLQGLAEECEQGVLRV